MTSVQINYLMIGVILVALFFVCKAARRVRPWGLWIIPIVILLLHGLIYSVDYILENAAGTIVPTVFNTWNNILRGHAYLTIIAYALTFILTQRAVRRE